VAWIVKSPLANGNSVVSKAEVIIVLPPAILLGSTIDNGENRILRGECGTELLLEDLSLLSVFAPLALVLALLAVVLFSVTLGHVILELKLNG
jgi:hypothetical protein